MINARVVNFIRQFLSNSSNEEELNNLIRQTRDPHLIAFAQHLVIHRLYLDTTDIEYGQYIAQLNALHRDAMRILNERGVNMYGNNHNINDLEALNTAEVEIFLLIWGFIHTYIDDDIDYGTQLAQRIAGLFLAPDTVTDDMMRIDNLPLVYRFFVYNFMMHGQLVNEDDIRAINQVLVPYVYGGEIPFYLLDNNFTGFENHLGVAPVGGMLTPLNIVVDS